MPMIRVAQLKDAEAIAIVHVNTWRSTYQDIIPSIVLEQLSVHRRTKHWKRVLDRDGENIKIFVAEDETGAIVGFCMAGPNRAEDSEFKAEIYAIYVLESHQGCGFGRALFESCKKWLLNQGLDSLIIWALRSNPYRKFYEVLGGEVAEKRKIAVGGTELDEVGYGWRLLKRHLYKNG